MADDFESPVAESGGGESSSPVSDPSLPASEQFVRQVAEKVAPGALDEQREEPAAERRASSEMARARADEAYRRRRETQNALNESRAQMARMGQELAQLRAMQQQALQAQQPRQNPDPEPDRNDPQKAHEWALWAARQGVAPVNQRVQQIEQALIAQQQAQVRQQQAYYQAQQQEQAFRGEVTRIEQLEAEYEEHSPGYRQRVDGYLNHAVEIHMRQGYPPLAAQAQAIQDLYALFQRGEQLGRHPAAWVDSYLGGYGSDAQGAAAQEAAAAPAPRRVREMQAASSAPEAGSLSQGGSRAPGEADPVSAMTRRGKGAVSARQLKKALAGTDARQGLNQIYGTAWKQSLNGQ